MQTRGYTTLLRWRTHVGTELRDRAGESRPVVGMTARVRRRLAEEGWINGVM